VDVRGEGKAVRSATKQRPSKAQFGMGNAKPRPAKARQSGAAQRTVMAMRRYVTQGQREAGRCSAVAKPSTAQRGQSGALL